jgi:hypothetical protein
VSKSTLDLTLTSDLRLVLIQIDGLRAMLRPDFTIRPEMIAMAAKASTDLSKTIGEVETWLGELRAEKYAKQTASHKAALTRSLRMPLRRRR